MEGEFRSAKAYRPSYFTQRAEWRGKAPYQKRMNIALYTAKATARLPLFETSPAGGDHKLGK